MAGLIRTAVHYFLQLHQPVESRLVSEERGRALKADSGRTEERGGQGGLIEKLPPVEKLRQSRSRF